MCVLADKCVTFLSIELKGFVYVARDQLEDPLDDQGMVSQQLEQVRPGGFIICVGRWGLHRPSCMTVYNITRPDH